MFNFDNKTKFKFELKFKFRFKFKFKFEFKFKLSLSLSLSLRSLVNNPLYAYTQLGVLHVLQLIQIILANTCVYTQAN